MDLFFSAGRACPNINLKPAPAEKLQRIKTDGGRDL